MTSKPIVLWAPIRELPMLVEQKSKQTGLSLLIFAPPSKRSVLMLLPINELSQFRLVYGPLGQSDMLCTFDFFSDHQVRNQIYQIYRVAKSLKLESFTTSKTDRHLLRKKVHQRISVTKTNTGVFDVFKTKHESQFSRITEFL